jgi:hypothetical protein
MCHIAAAIRPPGSALRCASRGGLRRIPPMCEVGAVCCEILLGCPLLRQLLLRGW